jgi:hypothetical protein
MDDRRIVFREVRKSFATRAWCRSAASIDKPATTSG